MHFCTSKANKLRHLAWVRVVCDLHIRLPSSDSRLLASALVLHPQPRRGEDQNCLQPTFGRWLCWGGSSCPLPALSPPQLAPWTLPPIFSRAESREQEGWSRRHHALTPMTATAASPRSSLIVRHTSAYVSIRQHTSAYVSIRQHTSGYVSIRKR